MSSITLHYINAPRDAGSVIAALHDLAIASRQLISALWATVTKRRAPAAIILLDEAENLRTVAMGLSCSAPRLAQYLFHAADRHELGINAD